MAISSYLKHNILGIHISGSYFRVSARILTVPSGVTRLATVGGRAPSASKASAQDLTLEQGADQIRHWERR